MINYTHSWAGVQLIGHELGHVIGLPHTFSGCNDDIYDDTYHPDLNRAWLDCGQNVSYTVNCTPPNYTGISNNIMGYNKCRSYLSPKQMGRIHFFNITEDHKRKYIQSDFDPGQQDVIVYNDAIWTSSKVVNSNIIIETNKELTIKCGVYLCSHSKIIVKPGAKLIIDGGKITSSGDSFWKGIQVWGNDEAHQYTINGQCAQGQVILKNGAVIENANRGVLLGKFDSGTDNYDDEYAGGIIKVEANYSLDEPSASFINNEFAVIFRPFQNFNPFSLRPQANLSYFTNAYFEANNDYPDTYTWHYDFVLLGSTKGVTFRGCTFTNQSDTHYGGGISCSGSSITNETGFSVLSTCAAQQSPCPEESIDRCRFENLSKGIYNGTSGSVNTIVVQDAIFANNSYGLKLTNVNNASILFNDFYIGQASDDEQDQCGDRASGYGIWMDNCTGFAIEENHFAKATGAPAGNYTGIYVNNTQAADEIYKNYFNGLSYANYAVGKNWEGINTWEGLAYYCNENTGNWQDICVVKNDQIPPVGGIQNPIGSDDLPAGNTFSDNANSNIYNDGDYWIGYFHYGDQSTPYYPDEVYRVIRSAVTDNQNGCPSHYGGGSGVEERGLVLSPEEKLETELAFAENLADYNNVKLLYDDLKDGGNTGATLEDVENSWPSDMWELREELLGKSPHLSMEVLKATADKTDVLPESIIFEIMAANPDELKKEELIKYLEDKENPLPGYMIDILEQVATGTTYKTVLQKEMAHYNRLKTRAAHDMIRSLVNDTILNTDKLRNWLDNLGGKRADEQIIASYVHDGNYTNALALAGMMPTLYNYTDEELAEHNYFTEMLNLGITLAQQGRSFFELDSTEVNNLANIANNSKGTGGAQARGILEAAYGYHFCTCLNVSDNSGYKSSGSFGSDSFSRAFGAEIEVKPNPASDWVSFNYVLPDNTAEGHIKISDVNGTIIKSFTLAGQQGQKVWDTRKTNAGMYFYTFTVNGMSKSGKLVINK